MPHPGLTIAVPLRSPRERRGAERFSASMPVSVDGAQGTTKDLSTSGLSFRVDRPCEPGAQVEVVIEYLLDGHHYPLRCEVEVVRSVRDGDGYTIGARLVARSQLEPVSLGEDVRQSRKHLRSVD